jgi:hypothetical protein
MKIYCPHCYKASDYKYDKPKTCPHCAKDYVVAFANNQTNKKTTDSPANSQNPEDHEDDEYSAPTMRELLARGKKSKLKKQAKSRFSEDDDEDDDGDEDDATNYSSRELEVMARRMSKSIQIEKFDNNRGVKIGEIAGTSKAGGGLANRKKSGNSGGAATAFKEFQREAGSTRGSVEID